MRLSNTLCGQLKVKSKCKRLTIKSVHIQIPSVSNSGCLCENTVTSQCSISEMLWVPIQVSLLVITSNVLCMPCAVRYHSGKVDKTIVDQ